MPIFGKKKEIGRGFIPLDRVRAFLSNNVPESDIIESLRKEGFSAEEIDKALTESFRPANEPQIPKPVAEKKEIEKPAFAPLFVKLERYRQILTSLEELRKTMEVIKSAFLTLNELDRLRYENMKIVESTVETVDKRLASLDAEFLRPSGFREELPSEAYTEGLESELSGLRNQIEQLKSELKTVA